VALVAGAGNALTVIDARNIVEAMNHLAPARPLLSLQLDTPAIDVVAATSIDPATNLEVSALAVKAFVATRSGQLLVLDVRLDSSGNAQAPTVLQRCGLSGVLPARLALAPGRDDVVYVADGAIHEPVAVDGAVSIAVAGIPAANQPLQPCAVTRLPAGGPARSIAISPLWQDADGKSHPAGELALIVLESGGVVFVRTADAQIVPAPPFDYADTGRQPMEPILIGGEARDATFLRSIKQHNNPNCPTAAAACVFVGDAVSGKPHTFSLLAAVASTDGGLYLVWFDRTIRRMMNENYFGNQPALEPSLSVPAVLSPASTVTDNPPDIKWADPKSTVAGRKNKGWFNAGVTRATRWRATWHADVPGLERRGGTVTQTAAGTLLFRTQPADLTSWTADPLLHLAPGDVVSFAAYFLPATGCDELSSETPARFELPILSIPDGSSLVLGTLPTFHPACPKFGVVAEIRIAGDHPWLVQENLEVRGRAKTGDASCACGTTTQTCCFAVTEPRFDYPFDYQEKCDPSDTTCHLPPLAASDIALAFTLTGAEPTVPGTQWSFTTASGQLPTVVRDVNSPLGLASQVIEYSSPKVTNLLFTTLTGANALIQATPDFLNVKGGVQAYR
jgi:hypothetical protein